MRKHVVIIGGGLSGLAATHDLLQAGYRTTTLEAAPDFGGLASSFRLQGIPVERFYHFICRSDTHLLQFLSELGLSDKVHWRHTRTAFYYHQRYYPFGTPLDLVRFSPIPWMQRLRFGFHVLRSRRRSEWRWLDQLAAKPWLIENIGEDAYQAIWHPLLKVKFGDYHDQISAAWIWHRIWRVAQSRRSLFGRETFGCLEHGTATLVEPLVERLRAHPNARFQSGVPVKPLVLRDGAVVGVRAGEQSMNCDAVISTVALPSLDRLIADQTGPYFDRLREIRYIGVVCMLLSLRHQFSPNFWTNINDPAISFNGIIEQSNLNHNLRRAGLNVVYVPFYLPTTAARYSADKETLFAEYVPMLEHMNPRFSRHDVKEYHVFRAPHAQAIFTTHFADLMPDHRTPIRGLYVTDSTQFYPEDRTISAAIEQGRKAAAMLIQDGQRQ
jgi:protoporphyrinogen oxidase